MNTRTTLPILVLLFFLIAGPAYPQNRDILQLQRDMIEVQTRVKQLQTTVDQDNAVMKNLLEKTTDQVNSMAVTMQKVSQIVEGMSKQNAMSSGELRALVSTLTGMVKEMEEGLTAVRGQVAGLSRDLTSIKTTSEPLASSDELWRNANTDYSQGNFDLAVGGFQEFIAKFPNDPKVADAHLRLGDSLAALKK